jgi:hypothetical protein
LRDRPEESAVAALAPVDTLLVFLLLDLALTADGERGIGDVDFDIFPA